MKNDVTIGDVKKSKVYVMSMTAVTTAVMCILGTMSIPIGVVPISFTSLVIYLSLYILGWKRGTLSYITYIFIGLVGLPVFSGFVGGPGRLFGPTGGYIIGFIPMAILSGIVIEKCRNRVIHFMAMVIGMIICYIMGTAWFCVIMNSDVMDALSICVFPFIAGDIVKIIIAIVIGFTLKQRLRAMYFLKE